MQQTSFQTCRRCCSCCCCRCGALSFCGAANCFRFGSQYRPTLHPLPPAMCVVTFNYLRMLAPDGEMRCDPCPVPIPSWTVVVVQCCPLLSCAVAFPSLISLTRSLEERQERQRKAKAEPKSKGPINLERHKICWQHHKNSHSGSWRLWRLWRLWGTPLHPTVPRPGQGVPFPRTLTNA